MYSIKYRGARVDSGTSTQREGRGGIGPVSKKNEVHGLSLSV